MKNIDKISQKEFEELSKFLFHMVCGYDDVERAKLFQDKKRKISFSRTWSGNRSMIGKMLEYDLCILYSLNHKLLVKPEGWKWGDFLHYKATDPSFLRKHDWNVYFVLTEKGKAFFAHMIL